MADVTISQLSDLLAENLGANGYIPVSQNGVTYRIPFSALWTAINTNTFGSIQADVLIVAGGGSGGRGASNSAGGGGAGGVGPGQGTPGTINTGGGGGGGSGNETPSPGTGGGSGIVMIRYKFQ